MDSKKIKKSNKVFIPFLAVIFSMFLSISAFAYDIPDNAYTMTLDSNAGDVILAVPYNVARYLSFEDNNLISEYNSSITLYGQTIVAGAGRELNVRLQPFQSAEYRFVDYTNTYNDFIIYDLIDSNVPFLQETDFTLFSQDTLVNMVVCLILGAIIVLMLKKR